MLRIIQWILTLYTPALLISCLRKEEPAEKHPQSDGLENAMLQEFRMTRDPQLNLIPRERLHEAKNYMERIIVPGGLTGRLTALAWQERGPNNVGGRTRTILLDKRDATGNTVFAASVSGGIFKTTNFTSATPTWSIVNDFLPNMSISALVQDPVNLNEMYAATGEGWFNIDAVRGGGIYKSTDGGTTWSLLPSTTGFEYVQDFVIDNNGNFFASLRNLISSNRGVVRSSDRGATWTQVLGLPLSGFNTGRAADLEVASNGDVYASLGVISRSEVYKSSFATHGPNTGALGTWTNITPVTPTVTQRTEIILAPSDPQRVYLLMQDSATSQVLNVYRSTNGGANWTTLPAPAALNNGTNSQTWFNLIGVVDPNNPNSIIVGGLNLARSTDGGDNWTSITNSSTVHVDHHALIFDGSTRLINGNDGGVYYSTNINAATPTFSNKNNGYNVTQYYACDIHPSANVNYYLAGSQDNGTQKFVQAGINTTTNATGGDGGFCHIDQTDGQLQITATTANNYNRSTNGGASFSSLGGSINNDRGQFINPSDLDDVQNILYSGDDPGRYYCISSLTGTPSAITVTVGVIGNQEVTAVKVDPFTSNTIWLGASFGTPAAVPKIYKLSNANTNSPTVVTAANIGSINNAAVSSIDVDPGNSNRILVTLSNFGVPSIWLSTNGGTSFISIEGNLPDMPVRWGMFAPANAELSGPGGGTGGILLGTELGVWTTSQINGASTQWIPNNTGLANVRTDMLKYRSSDNTLIAATHGRGLFSTNIPGVVTGIGGPPDNTKDFIRYINAQNNNLLIVTGTLQTRTMTIQLFDMTGKKLYETTRAYRNTNISTATLPQGVYTLRCLGNNKELYLRKFVK
jgi:hypothetical protein